ncbi:unnamed protein product [Fraxinus pennsylvanica]|uniref:Uncharacterized protein n=1 Tax=Fraxinus pennsylvanica TaxID=56036 RepID=A0AAD2E7E9_9LAMI|nr:unnamed protein product [Fraxinus pennsylvanica]
MAYNRKNSTVSFRVPRPTTHLDVEEISSTHVDPNSRTRHVRWSDVMDGGMITALLHQLLTGHKRSDNDFSSYHVSKAIESVYNECGVMGKPQFGKWRTKLCPGHDDLEAIFGNDSATGDCAVTSNNNFSPIHDENVNEVDDQNEDMDRSPIRSPKRNTE